MQKAQADVLDTRGLLVLEKWDTAEEDSGFTCPIFWVHLRSRFFFFLIFQLPALLHRACVHACI